jgi:hydroxymethylpyrimidine/phosphomethylpyrimidine kinase
MAKPPVVLVVSGWDPSGASGMAQDLKVLAALGVHACGAPSALTVQGRQGVVRVQGVEPALLKQQLQILLKEQPIAAVKLGLLPAEAQLEAVAQALLPWPKLPVILDPVLSASAGGSLVEDDFLPALKEWLPRISLLTPNLLEAAVLCGQALEMEAASQALLAQGARAVLLKGGHSGGQESRDLYRDAETSEWLLAPRIQTHNSRGTGCALASAVAAYSAQGQSLLQACVSAKTLVTQALSASQGDDWGGPGPLRFWP